jgi:predicted transposase YdaD
MIFIDESPEEVLEMAKEAKSSIARAEEVLKRLGNFDEIRRYYEAREIAIHDEITRLAGARAEGRAEGRTEGRAEGKTELVLKQLSKKFGFVPSDIRKKIDESSLTQLDIIAEEIFDFQSIDDTRKYLQ